MTTARLSKTVDKVRDFAHEHDDIPAFHAAYLVGTLLAAALFNLAFFLLVILLHMALDYVKYRDIHQFNRRMTVVAVLRESLLDIALFMVALTFSLYLHESFLAVAASGFARAELTILRAAGTLAPKIRMLENIMGVVLNLQQYMHSMVMDPRAPLRVGEKWAIFTIVVCGILLGLAFALFPGYHEQIVRVLREEFTFTL